MSGDRLAWLLTFVMCGICGIALFDTSATVDAGAIRQMTDAMVHRGPDDEGLLIRGRHGLGHRRLTIIDLNSGKQPLSNEDGTVWTVFNGELYNYQEIRARLEGLGHVFSTTTDTEVIVHLYEQDGDAFVESLQGMFAIAVLDLRQDRLVLVRDRLGIKPLYYKESASGFEFASEIKSLLAGMGGPCELDINVVHRFLTFTYLPGRETLLKNVFKVLPGEQVIVQGSTVRRAQYWDLDFGRDSFHGNFDDAIEELDQRFRVTVSDYMVSDVPVGVLLSGGLDSSAILDAARQSHHSNLPCFTVGFDASGVPDERPYARIAAEKLGGDIYEITVKPEEFCDFLPKYVHWMEEPVCEPPAIALHRVAELAARHVKVVLSGEGGDEGFAGYSNYANEQKFERYARILGPLGRMAAGIGIPPGTSARMAKIREALRHPLESRYLSRTSGPERLFNRLGSDAFEPSFLSKDSYEWSIEYVRKLWDRTRGWTPLQSMLYVDTKTWLPDDLLVKADKMTMANSLELRVPLLDHALLEFAASLPDDMKLRNGTSKAVFRSMVSKRLPKPLVERKKAGFPVPYANWFRQELSGYLRDVLLGDGARIHQFVRESAVRSLIEDHGRGVGSDRSKELFCLLVLELWIREFIG